MRNDTKYININSVNLLTKLWSDRYVPDLSILTGDPTSFFELGEFASPQGRAKTVVFMKRLLNLDCEWGVAKTNTLLGVQFSSLPNTSQMTETLQLIYNLALEFYQQQPSDVSKQLAVVMPDQLATTFEPLFTTLRQQHISTNDPRSIGFISTQFHYTNQLLLDQLSVPERILLSPYFRFLEEQVCIPFGRVCLAGGHHELDSPTLMIVRQLLPACHDIAKTVYRRAVKLHTSHQSCRGKLSHPGVKASTIRDFEMMQAHLLLSILENSFAVVEQELIPLCLLVFPSVRVTWTLVQQVMAMLMDEVIASVEPEQKKHLQSYTNRMLDLFLALEQKAI